MAVALSKVVVPGASGWHRRCGRGSTDYLLLGFGALILAGGMGLDGFSGDMKVRSFSWLQPGTVLAGIAVCLVSVGGAVWWVLAGAHAPIERSRLDAIPPVRHECYEVRCAPQGCLPSTFLMAPPATRSWRMIDVEVGRCRSWLHVRESVLAR